MTECRNCKDGFDYTKPYLVTNTNEATEKEVVIFDVCPCCQGWHENCPNCEREFPNSIVAVQMGND